MIKTNSDQSESAREMSSTRVFDAPRQRVFDAWKDPATITHWWGPRGFTTTTHEMDFRPGGVWHFTMHGPDGVDYPNRVVYEVVDEPARLVYAHMGEGEHNDVQFRVVVTFSEKAGKTELTFRGVFPTAEERDRVVDEFGALEGLYDTLTRLSEHLAKDVS